MTAPAAGPATLRRRVLRILGRVVGVVAIALCGWALVRQWDEVGPAVRSADPWLLLASVGASAVASILLAVLWHRCLRALGARRPLRDVLAWYFGGEIGKYLPGAVWSVLGRGELSARGGVDRRTSYVATVLGLGLAVVGGAWFCGIVGPVSALLGGPQWSALLAALLPIGAVVIHPRVVGAGMRVMHLITRDDRRPPAPSWGVSARLAALSVASWCFVAIGAILVSAALAAPFSPAAVATASVAAWTAGLVAIPVPAGIGVRELVFAALSGLGAGIGVAVAGLCRLTFIITDGVATLAALAYLRARAGRARGKEGP